MSLRFTLRCLRFFLPSLSQLFFSSVCRFFSFQFSLAGSFFSFFFLKDLIFFLGVYDSGKVEHNALLTGKGSLFNLVNLIFF